MSEENAEIVRKAIDAVNAFMRTGSREQALNAAAELNGPEIEFHWHDTQTLPDLHQHLRGTSEMKDFWLELRSAWADVTIEPLEFIEAPEDRVVVFVRQTGRGRQSGVPAEVRISPPSRSGM